jgi:signal transduction histidine kinase
VRGITPGARPGVAGPLARLRDLLGTPGVLLAVFSVVMSALGLAVLAREYDRLRRTGREALRPVVAGWVRTLPVHYLGWTLPDYAERWNAADAADRPRALADLRGALLRLGDVLDRPETRPVQLVEMIAIDLGVPGKPALASWRPRGNRPAAPSDLADAVPVADAGPIRAAVRYRVGPEYERAASGLEGTYRRLVLAVAGLSLYPLLCLVSMALGARALRDRTAREAAQAATLDLADRTCHELGNVAFVLANERRNLADHLEMVQRLVDDDPAALDAAAARAGLEPAQLDRLRKALRRERNARGIDPEGDLAPGLALARDVTGQIAICTDYIAQTVRELDGYLKQSTVAIEPVAVAVDDCLDDAVAILGPRLASSGARVERPPRDPSLRVRADRRLLVQALVNLLKNAIEAAPGAPGIAIEVEPGARGASCRLVVRDDGPGIPADTLPRLFEPGTTTKGPGRGRGLAIVRQSIAAQGGAVEARNRPEGGAEFAIRLPSA